MKHLLPLFLTSLVVASDDGGFANFCQMDWLDSRFDEKEPTSRFKELGQHKFQCEQTFPIPQGLSKEEAVDVCHSMSPFRLNVAETESNFGADRIKCIWESSGICERGSVLIKSNCYTLSDECTAGWTEASLGSSTIKWLSIFFPHHQLVKFKHTTANRPRPDVVYHHGYVHPAGNGSQFKSNGKMVAVLQRHSAAGLYPGDYVFLHDYKETEIPTVCQQKAYGVPASTTGQAKIESTGKPSETGTAATAYKKICANDDSWCMKSPRNLFQPKMKQGLVDMKHFHEFCAKFCTDCFAASDYHYKGIKNKLPNGRYYVPIANQKRVSASSDCQAAATQNSANEFNQLRIGSHVTVGSDLTAYISGYPSNGCSDGGRLAAQYFKGHGKEGLMDAPVFDRLPIYCVSGRHPPAPAGGKCMKNAEKKGNNCQCKPGYHDALTESNVAEHARSRGAEPGQVCLRDGKDGQECTKVVSESYNYDAILFHIDGSGSIATTSFSQMTQFLLNAKTWIPKKCAVLFHQYSSIGKYRYSYKGANWNNYNFDQAVNEVSVQLYGDTYTWTLLRSFIEQWNNVKASGDKALLFIITDGAANDYDIQEETVQWVKSQGVYIKMVMVGGTPPQGVVEKPGDAMSTDSYGNLEKDILNSQTTEHCEYTNAKVDDAMQY